MYVSPKFRINTSDQINAFISSLNETQATWSDLITIDYFYNNHMPDYDYGLSFLDRIHKKIGQFHPEWNIDDLKNSIRYARNPVGVYSDIIQYMFNDPRDVLYYGI